MHAGLGNPPARLRLQMTNHLALNRHPRWPLYKKLRRSIKRELDADLPRSAPLTGEINDQIVDGYLLCHLGEITREIKKVFLEDLQARDRQIQAELVRGVARI